MPARTPAPAHFNALARDRSGVRAARGALYVAVDALRDRIVQKFARTGATGKRAQGGTGLGLNITKAIVEKHCGTIDFISEPGIRTEFYFDLPWQAPHTA